MPEQTRMKVVVVGAGIAGLAAAIAIRAPGRDVVVLESSRLNSEVGAAIHLAPNATKILNKWGLDVKKAAKATVCREVAEIGSDGVEHMRIPIDTESQYGAPWLFQHRVDLHNALRDFAEATDRPGDPAKIITGQRVVSVDTHNGLVETADGQKYYADLIIGADGHLIYNHDRIHSKVRDAILGQLKVAEPSGHSAYRCLIDQDDLRDIPESSAILNAEKSSINMIVGGDRRIVMYPCRNATVLNIVAICPDTMLQEESEQSWNQDGSTGDMLTAFEGFPSWVLRTLSRAGKPGLWQLRDQEPLPTWVKGRAIIIGDAAHAMLPHQGQGAGQSIEDAEAIGTFFANIKGPGDPGECHQRLQMIFDGRIKRASTVQQYSRQQANPAGGGSSRVQLNAMQFADYNMGYNGIIDWLQKEAQGQRGHWN